MEESIKYEIGDYIFQIGFIGKIIEVNDEELVLRNIFNNVRTKTIKIDEFGYQRLLSHEHFQGDEQDYNRDRLKYNGVRRGDIVKVNGKPYVVLHYSMNDDSQVSLAGESVYAKRKYIFKTEVDRLEVIKRVEDK